MDYKGIISRVSREDNSRSGNPRYRIEMHTSVSAGVKALWESPDVEFLTPVNAGWVYGINFDNLVGQHVTVKSRLLRKNLIAEQIIIGE